MSTGRRCHRKATNGRASTGSSLCGCGGHCGRSRAPIGTTRRRATAPEKPRRQADMAPSLPPRDVARDTAEQPAGRPATTAERGTELRYCGGPSLPQKRRRSPPTGTPRRRAPVAAYGGGERTGHLGCRLETVPERRQHSLPGGRQPRKSHGGESARHTDGGQQTAKGSGRGSLQVARRRCRGGWLRVGATCHHPQQQRDFPGNDI